MKKILIPLAFLVLASLACGQYTVGNIQEEPTVKPTIAVHILPTVSPTPEPLATPAREILVTVGSWHVRHQPKPGGESLIIPSGTRLEVIIISGDWLLVQTVDADPYSVLCGFIHKDCCILKEKR